MTRDKFEDKDFRRFDNETEEDYQIRICGLKDIKGLKWDEVAQIINEELDWDYGESKYRKWYSLYLKGKTDGEKESEIEMPEITEYMQQKIELQKLKVKVSDERIQANAYIRQLAREETIKEIAFQCAKEMNDKKMLGDIKSLRVEPNDNRAILMIGDWHYGLDICNYWNTYNPEIACQRVRKLTEETIKKCNMYNVKELHIVNLADLIAGRIHLGLRLESRFDVITQTMQVSEILSEMICELSQHFNIHYYDCLDNHSRLEPNKKDAMDLESLARIIPWYLKERFGDKINIHENKFDEGIISFKCGKYSVIGCHGDHDKPNKVVDNMTLMTHEHYDMVLTAHLHHFSCDENHETVVVSNGSLMGTDTFAKNLRLCSKPSQNLVIVTNESVCEDICRIVLD